MRCVMPLKSGGHAASNVSSRFRNAKNCPMFSSGFSPVVSVWFETPRSSWLANRLNAVLIDDPGMAMPLQTHALLVGPCALNLSQADIQWS